MRLGTEFVLGLSSQTSVIIVIVAGNIVVMLSPPS